MKFTTVALISLVLAPSTASAITYGFGIATARAPALSLHVREDAGDAYHFTAHYDPTYMQLTADYQRFYEPNWGYGSFYKCALYTGAGLAGETRASDTAQEDYHLRFPIGIQAAFDSLHLQTFFETTALLGTLPRTNFAATVSAGVRAQF